MLRCPSQGATAGACDAGPGAVVGPRRPVRLAMEGLGLRI